MASVRLVRFQLFQRNFQIAGRAQQVHHLREICGDEHADTGPVAQLVKLVQQVNRIEAQREGLAPGYLAAVSLTAH